MLSETISEKIVLNRNLLPVEIFYHIFQALNRNEIEKCQLVCHNWFSIIQRHSHILPLHLFYRLKFGKESTQNDSEPNFEEIFLFTTNEKTPIKICLDSFEIISSLKYCVFMACGPVKLNYFTYESIQKLAKKCGQKLRTNIFTTFGHFYDRLDDCAEFLLCILRKSILAEKIALTLNEEDTYHFLENPGFLKIPLSIATEITFHCDTFIFDSGRNLIDFIKIGDLFGANRYSLRLSNLNSYLDFCEDYLEIFQTVDPRKHLKNISFSTWTLEQFQRTIFDLERRYLKPKVLVHGEVTIFSYEIKRTDGWILNIRLSEQFNGSLSKIMAEFNIDKH